jgi:hypothetical protein
MRRMLRQAGRAWRAGAVALLACALAGCVMSVHPLGEDGDAVFDASLPGLWVSLDAAGEIEASVRVQRLQRAPEPAATDAPAVDPAAAGAAPAAAPTVADGYRIEFSGDDGERGVFEGRLLALGPERFLELRALTGAYSDVACQKSITCWLLVRPRLLLHVVVEPGRVRYRTLRRDWLREVLRASPDALAHVVLDDGNVLVTAPTRDWQAFVRRHLETPGAFDAFVPLLRASTAAAPR